MDSTQVSSLLQRMLQLTSRRELTIGRLKLVVANEARSCEGICTPETDEECLAEDHPPVSWDYVVRGFCGPRMIRFGEIAVHQTKVRGVEYPIDRVCCLECAI
jgi:hypothetical protein